MLSAAIPEITSTTAAFTIYAFNAIHAVYKENKNKEKIGEMTKINEFHAQCLEELEVLDHSSSYKIKTPKVFIFEGDKPPKSLVLTPEILRQLNETRHMPEELHLIPYTARVHNAMIKLREYYSSRIHNRDSSQGDEEDVTSGVIAYIILMLSTHCYKVVDGHGVTLAYLKGLYSFVNKFGSAHGEQSDRYEKISLVYHDLKDAYDVLLHDSLAFSYKSVLYALTREVMEQTNKLLNSAVRLITAEKNWPCLEFLTPQKISDGVLQYQSKHSHSLTSGNSIEIIDSPFKIWLKRVADEYTHLIEIEDKEDFNVSFIANNKFSMDFADTEKSQIREVFKEGLSFLTIKVHQDSKKSSQWTHIAEEEDIQERTKIYLNIILMIDKLNTLFYFCAHLSKRVDQLGEIYFANQEPCIFLFKIFNDLGTVINKQCEDLLLSITEIHQSARRIMYLEVIQTTFDELRDILEFVHLNIIKTMKTLYVRHKEYPRRKDIDFSKVVEQNLNSIMQAALKIEVEYKISPSEKYQPHFSYSPPAPLIQKDEKQDDHDSKIGLQLEEIRRKIVLINLEDPTQAQSYLKIFNSIDSLYLKMLSLKQSPILMRKERGKKLKPLISEICNDLTVFLAYSHDVRIAKAASLSAHIHARLNPNKTSFLDREGWSNLFNKTGSRKRANQIQENAKQLVRSAEYKK